MKGILCPLPYIRHTMKFTLILALLLPIMLESSAKLCRRYVQHPIVPTQMMKSKVHKIFKSISSILCMFVGLISAAAQRKYESLRRQWKAEESEDFVEKSRRISLLKRYRSRRKRVSYSTIAINNFMVTLTTIEV